MCRELSCDVGAYVRNRPSFIFIWRWHSCTYIDVVLFQSFHNMFVVDVALFQYFHNMFVVVVAYSPPALGLTPPLSFERGGSY